jgi:hypothetical protein
MATKQDEIVEIPASELAALRKGYSLLEGLTSGDDAIDIQRRLKKLDPTLNFPVIDQGDKLIAPVRTELEETKAALAKLREERDADLLERQNDKALGSLQASIDRVSVERKFAGETKQKFIDFMAAKGIADPDLAAPAFIETLPKPPAPLKTNGYLPQTMHLFGAGDTAGSDESIAELHRDPVAWQDKMTAQIMNEDAA